MGRGKEDNKEGNKKGGREEAERKERGRNWNAKKTVNSMRQLCLL